jgi:hypothetical protein
MLLEVLDLFLVLLGSRFGLEGAEVSPFSGLFVLFARIDAVFAGG